MPNYVLTTEALRVVKRNDRGTVTYRKRYKKGDVVDVENLAEDRLDQLLASGALVEEGAEDAAFEDAEDESPEQGFDEDTPAEDEDADEDTEREPGSHQESEAEIEAEDFEAMDYPTLQRLAKERTGDGSGGKEALVERLQEWADSARS